MAERIPLVEQVESLPASPGVYLFRSRRDVVLYVGKAQNLRGRVRSYLRAGGDGRLRIPHLIERAVAVEAVVTPTVKDALLLENELIKRHKPPFNVRLRDDKQYLGLRLDPRERWPRLVSVRRFAEDGAEYFGPYTSSQSLRGAISNLRRALPLRSCTDAVFRDYARRGRPCIEYEMGRCPAPCCDFVTPEVYAESVRGTALFLRGRSDELIRDLERRMEEEAAAERFETAARLRDRLAALRETVGRQQIVTDRAIHRDVFGLAREGEELEIHALHVRGGRVADYASFSFRDIALDDAEALLSFLGQYYGAPDRRPTPEIWISRELPEGPERVALGELLRERAQGCGVAVRRPQRGSGRQLLAMAERNAVLRLQQRRGAEGRLRHALEELRQRLRLRAVPHRVECYDISHLGGALAVASRVTFVAGRAEKGGYRRYRIRDAPAGDDYACLREVMARRLAACAREPLPDLLMVDGGKGQLGVVRAALRDAGFENDCDLLGLSKERDAEGPSGRVRRGGGLKAEKIHLAGRVDAVSLAPSSAGLLLLQQIRDEAHRFAIEFQRQLRGRSHRVSILEEIPGIGPVKRRALLRDLGSLRAVRRAEPAVLARVPGVAPADADRIRHFFAALDTS